MRSGLFLGIGLCSLLAAGGCGDSDESPAGADVRKAALTTPLTAEDVHAFLKVVERLPGGTAPEFRAPAFPAAVGRLAAEEFVAKWRREFQSAYHPSVQARLWRGDGRLSAALDGAQIDPKAMASLIVRLSSAVARDALDGRVQLDAVRRDAEELIASLCREIEKLEASDSLPPALREGRRDQLLASLKDVTAFREFIRLLEAVPPESVATVGRFRQELRKHLPTSEALAAFERRTESMIMPTSYETSRPEAPRQARRLREAGAP